ncbi:MAG: cell division topological specificity factor MinE [Clostridiales bacterium]|nr:cell division topological specificity factor MinE [Clostridiales bacterium]
MGQTICFHKSNSGEIARMRLKLLLVSDQSHISPGILDRLRDDVTRVLSGYAQVDASRITLGVRKHRQQDEPGAEPIFYISFPLRQKYLEKT